MMAFGRLKAVVSAVLALFVLLIPDITADADPQQRSPTLKKLDADLKRLGELAPPYSEKPIPSEALRLAARLAPTIERIIRRDLKTGSRQSEPWAGGDGEINTIRRIFEASGNPKVAEKWRDLWLLNGAKFDYLESDFAGAGWFFVALAEAKYRAPEVYEQALAWMGETRKSYCTDGMPLKVCVLRTGGDVLRSLTAVAAGLDLEQDALRRVEAASDIEAERVVSYQLRVALAEWSVGSLARASEIVGRASRMIARHGKALSAGPRYRYHVLEALIADARLEDARAAQHFLEALKLRELAQNEIAVGNAFTEETLRGEIRAATAELLDLVYRIVVTGQCAACKSGQVRAIEAFLVTQPDLTEPYLIARAAPEGLFDQAIIKSIRDGIIRERAENSVKGFAGVREDMEKWVQTSGRTISADRLYDVIALGLFAGFHPNLDTPRAGVRFILAKSVSEAKKYVKASLGNVKTDQFEQFGADLDYLAFASRFAAFLDRLGFKSAYQVVLEDLVQELRDGFKQDPEMAGLADLSVPAFVNLAALSRQQRRGDNASKLLREALAAVNARLEREWRLSNRNAAASLGRMLPTISRAAFVQAGAAQGGNSWDADAAIAWLQLASTGDTAIAGQTTIIRRLNEASGAGDLLASREAGGLRLQRLLAMKDNLSALFRPTGIDAAIARQRREIAALDRKLASRNGKWTRHFAITPVTTRQIAGTLRPDEALVIMHAGEGRVTAALVPSKAQPFVWSVALGKSELASLVTTIRRGVDLSEGGLPDFSAGTAFALWQKLFGPVAERLREYRHLIFSVDGPLQSLPFGILVTQKPDKDVVAPPDLAAAPLAWFARDRAISVVPSASMFVRQRAQGQPSRARQAFLGVGNPVLAPVRGASRRVDFDGLFTARALADASLLRQLASLPETADELKRIANVLGADASALMLGAKATESAVRRAALADYRVLAFATHGLVAGALSGHVEPGLVLTPPDQPTAADDGLLTMSEIMELKLDADLVILSACDTATSDGRPRADGLSGLARAFFAAGARSLVVTHWAIPSGPAVKVTTGLVQARATEPKTPWAEALRRSVKTLMDSADPGLAHPASWGAFQIVGTN